MKASYTNLFIEISKYTIATVVVVTGCIASAAIASSQNIKAPQNVAMYAKSAQLAIKSPKVNLCQAEAKMAGWIQTSKPGKIEYMLARKDGNVSGPFKLDAVKSINGGMASFTKSFQVQSATDTEYRILVSGSDGKVMSNWAPLKASCTIKLGG